MTQDMTLTGQALEGLENFLPAVMIEIAQLIGYDQAYLLVKAIGGTDFAIPRGCEDSMRARQLIAAIGQEDARILMEIYGGSRLYIPRCHLALTELRNQAFFAAIEQDMALGSSQSAAIQAQAPRFGFSERWAYQLLNKKRQVRAQQSFLLSLGWPHP